MPQSLILHDGNDKVYTPEILALRIIHHFNPSGAILDPCTGKGAFFNNFPANSGNDYCEIDQNKDFLTYNFGEKKFKWVIGNFPWSKIRPFHKKAMSISDNVVSLCLINAIFMKAQLRDMEELNFGIREIVQLDTPPKPWPQTGFALGAIHLKREYKGDIKFSKL